MRPARRLLVILATNLSGVSAATTAEQAREQLGYAVSVYLEGGASADTGASTIVDVTGEVNDTFDVAAVERTLGIDISDDIVRTLNLGTEDAVLVADSVTPNG